MSSAAPTTILKGTVGALGVLPAASSVLALMTGALAVGSMPTVGTDWPADTGWIVANAAGNMTVIPATG